MIDVEGWVEIREIHRRTSLHRENDPPRPLRRSAAALLPLGAPSKLDPFEEEIGRILRSDPRIPTPASAS